MLRVYVGINPLLPPPLRAAPDFLHHWWGCSTKDVSIEVQLNRRWKNTCKADAVTQAVVLEGSCHYIIVFFSIFLIGWIFAWQSTSVSFRKWQGFSWNTRFLSTYQTYKVHGLACRRFWTDLLSTLFQMTDLGSSWSQWIPNLWHEKASQNTWALLSIVKFHFFRKRIPTYMLL